MHTASGLELSALSSKLSQAFDFAARQLRHLVETQPDSFPMYTVNGKWKHGAERWTNWCEGFLGGQLWLLYQHTGDAYWRQKAEHYSRLIEHRKSDRSVHDLGFLFWPTWKRWYDLTGNPALKAVVIEAGRTLSLRFQGKGGYLVRGDGSTAHEGIFDPASYDEVMAVNLKGPFFLTQAVARAMIDLVQAGLVEQPMIVNVGSISAYTGSLNRAEYCLSKAGLAMMTALYADRLAEYGIPVYEVRPGIIETDMTRAVREKYDRLIGEGLTPMRRWGQPEDVARAVAALAEGYFPFSTGEIINVDGGFHLRRL